MANEKRLIDANAIYNAVERRYRVSSGIEHRSERDLLDLICSAETVDAVEVVHGRWILEQKFADGTADYKCSACDYDDTFHCNLVNAFYKYCPNCGAKMDGGNEDG